MASDRRTFIKQAAGASALAGLPPFAPSAAAATRAPGDRLIFSTANPVVKTTNGPVRGYIRNQIHTFRGIAYGASTAGANRFMPPRKPEPWTDVRTTAAYKYACHQLHGDDWSQPFSHFLMDYEFG